MTAAHLDLVNVSPSARPSRWTLAKTVVTAYASRPAFAGVRPWLLRPTFWLQLVLGDWRANPSGTAVCSLNTGSLLTRIKATITVVALLAVAPTLVIFSSVTWPLIVALALLAIMYLPLARRSLTGIPARRRLRRTRPPGPLVFVHTVASIEPGAGRALLETVNTEADAKGWTMTLDAANENLARYYTQLGYQPLGPPVLMPYGERVVPMIRHPELQLASQL
jgi:hypothetical protein